MKICYLTNNLDPKNGWGRYASDLIYGVKNSGHEVIILKEQDDGFEGMPILKRGLGLFSSALKIKKLIKDCDIIHALDGYPFGIIAALANRFIKKKLITSAQGSYAIAPLYNRKTSRFLKWAYEKSDWVVAISNYTKSELFKKVNPKNIAVINHGINLSEFYSSRLETNESFILSVGAVKPRKGYHISIQAFALVKKDIPGLKYKIAGEYAEDNYFRYLKKLIRSRGLGNDDIEFLGQVSTEELIKLYRTARVFVLTSVNENHHFEGFGLVFLEAAAAGLPVIGTKGNGIEDAVKNDYNGFLVLQNSVDQTAEVIINVLDPVRYSQLSHSSYNWAKQNTVDKMIDKYLKLYLDLYPGHKSGLARRY